MLLNKIIILGIIAVLLVLTYTFYRFVGKIKQ